MVARTWPPTQSRRPDSPLPAGVRIHSSMIAWTCSPDSISDHTPSGRLIARDKIQGFGKAPAMIGDRKEAFLV
jgi:hypothetical protein